MRSTKLVLGVVLALSCAHPMSGSAHVEHILITGAGADTRGNVVVVGPESAGVGLPFAFVNEDPVLLSCWSFPQNVGLSGHTMTIWGQGNSGNTYAINISTGSTPHAAGVYLADADHACGSPVNFLFSVPGAFVIAV